MLYTASYFEPENHHGRLISISRSTPKGFHVHDCLTLFVPSSSLLTAWKEKRVDREGYVDRYREEIRLVWPRVKVWATSLDPSVDVTLLCWEKKGAFCHRNLVAKVVEKLRPDAFGGRDICRSSR